MAAKCFSFGIVAADEMCFVGCVEVIGTFSDIFIKPQQYNMHGEATVSHIYSC